MNIDLHVHTTASSCSSFTPLMLIHGARVEQLEVLVTTNHGDSHGDTDYLRQRCREFGILYCAAIEITTPWGDFLLYGENLENFQGHLDAFPCQHLPNPDIAVIWAHPFEFFTDSYVESIKNEVSPYIDAVEVINGNCLRRRGGGANAKAQKLAHEIEKFSVAGSDAHSARRFFTTWTEFTEPVKSYSDLVCCIKTGKVRLPDITLQEE